MNPEQTEELIFRRFLKRRILLTQKLNESIEKKLQISHNFSLIGDIWTTRTILDFQGLAAGIMNEHFERKVLAIGMKLMPGNHCAEKIQKETESIVNKFDFQKNKIKTISFHEG